MNGIYTVVGARPNFIKLDKDLPQTIIHTGQHYDYEMSKVFFEDMDLPAPKLNLDLKNYVGQMIDALMFTFKEEKPSMVLVFGDTHSSLAGALAAAYCNIPVAHVEAGMRSNNSAMPEEVNRKVIDHISKVLLCPNKEAALNLDREGIKENVFVVGDPMADALLSITPVPDIPERRGKYIFATIHRNTNVDDKDRLKEIFEALGEIGEEILMPLHPRTGSRIEEFGIKVPDNVKFMMPQKYKETIKLASNARLVITDSGGLQKEAFWMNVPVVIPRKETEWNEIIEKGGGVLAYSKDDIVAQAKSFRGKINPAPEFGAKEKIRKVLYKFI